MKKLISLLLCAVLLVMLAACASQSESKTPMPTEPSAPLEPTEPSILPSVPNPMRTLSSLDELNEAIGGNLCRPGVMGVTNESYRMIEGSISVAEYSFTLGSTEFVLRCSAETKADISGLYFGDGTAFSDEATEEMQTASDATWKTARWLAGGMQYVLSVRDVGTMETETFVGIAEEFQTATSGIAGMVNPVTELDSLAALNEAIGGHLCKPGVMGVTDEQFLLIDGGIRVADYTFTVGGTLFSLRCSAEKTEDISGLYFDGTAAFSGAATEDASFSSDATWKAARWLSEGLQYVLSVKDSNTMEDETFRGIAEEFRIGVSSPDTAS